jgi:hypothetical protein
MKKQILFLSCLVGAVLLTSCEKESLTGNELIDLKEQTIKKVVFNLPDNGRSNSTSGTMMSFATIAEYENTIQMLQDAIENNLVAFYAQYGHLEGDELDDLIDSLGFNEYQPLIDFEEQHGFTNSMRKKMQGLEELWLANEVLDPETDPDNGNLFDIFDQTLYNEEGEIMIAGRILSYDKPDYDYEIINDYENSLTKINNGEDVSTDPNIESFEKNNGTCLFWKEQHDWDQFSSNRKVKRKVKVRRYWGGTQIITTAKIVSHRKKTFGWARSGSMPIGVKNETKLHNPQCSPTSNTPSPNFNAPKKRKEAIARITVYNGGAVYTIKKNFGLKGTYYYNWGTVNSKYLN